MQFSYLLSSYIIGTFFSWRIQALISSLIPLLIFLLMIFVPESPTYLVKKNRAAEASQALMRYRGATDFRQIEAELQDVI